MRTYIPKVLERMFHEEPALKRAFLVGGCVRDWLCSMPIKDIDIEVFDIGYADLVRALSRWGRADLVGKSFGVVKLVLDGEILDFSLPRRDSKIGAGHKGFDVVVDPTLTLLEASSRRDFTINSMSWDPRTDQVIDLHGGQSDLNHRILRHTSSAFVEDPLRVLRGMQFAARLDLIPAQETVELCRQIRDSYHELPKDRIREEWLKWASKSIRPSRGLQFLERTGWIDHFPELKAMLGVIQDLEWHPEGDVWTHTLHALDALVDLEAWKSGHDAERIVWSFSVLLHDIGKSRTTSQELRDGRMRVVSPGHEVVSGELAQEFLERIDLPNDFRERIVPLVVNHMAHLDDPTPRAVRRLANRLCPASVQDLTTLMTADASGRPPLPRRVPLGAEKILARATELQVLEEAPRPILMGRHLQELGVPPGRAMGRILQEAFEAQLDGAFEDRESAIQWISERLPRPSQSPQP